MGCSLVNVEGIHEVKIWLMKMTYGPLVLSHLLFGITAWLGLENLGHVCRCQAAFPIGLITKRDNDVLATVSELDYHHFTNLSASFTINFTRR